MNKVVEVLMNRDNMTKSEAEGVLANVREMIQSAVDSGNYDEVEEILASELGLEMDYIFDILM